MRIKFLAIVLMVNCTVLSFAQGIEFFHGTWEEVKAKAKEADKLVFVDAYTTWCGPCKRMAANIFPLPEVGEFYNANFINYKLDMEKGFVDIVWFCVEITSIKLPHKPVTVRATLLLESDKKTIEETVEYKLKPEQRVYEGPSILLQ